MPPRTWILTDVEQNVAVETFALTPDDVPEVTAKGWAVAQQPLRGGLRDGVALLSVCNGPLLFHVLPTRGMGLWRGDFRSTFLGWRAPVVGPVHPKFVDLDDRRGLGWLAGFDEWLCRCGLASNGPPGKDGDAELTLHGRIANRPAHRVTVSIDPAPPHTMTVTGVVEEGGLFLGRLRLTTTYSTVPGSNRIDIHDVVENLSGRPAELQMLYHLNLGEPLLGAGSRVVVPVRELAPHTPHAARAVDTWDTYAGPRPGFAEEVFDILPAADPAGRTLALLRNAAGDRGLAVRWSLSQLPYFTLWKNTAATEDGYVTGLEPGTNFPFFKAHERDRGRVLVVPPGGRWEAAWSVEIADTTAAVDQLAAEAAALQAATPPKVHRSPVFGP